jgi:hypothetical protein
VIHRVARTPLPDGLPAVSIAGRTDPVVPVPRTHLDGARSVVIPITSIDAHSLLPGDPRTTRELGLALVGAPPRCRDFTDALLDQASGRLISGIEDLVGTAATGLSVAAAPVEAATERLDAALSPALEGASHPR